MLKKSTYTILAVTCLLVSSCSETTESKETESSNKDNTEQESVTTETTSEDQPDIKSNIPETSSKYQYDQDWEIFKTAVINKDIKGVSAFASSDEIDAEVLVEAFNDPDFLNILKEGKYEDLTTDTSGDQVLLVFSALFVGDDGDGNTFESGLYLYFSQGENGLQLENFFAAG